MENKYIPIEQGLPEANMLLVIFLLNPGPYQLPFRLAYFTGTDSKFAFIGGEAGTSTDKDYISGYHYILDKDGNRVRAIT